MVFIKLLCLPLRRHTKQWVGVVAWSLDLQAQGVLIYWNYGMPPLPLIDGL